MFYIPCFCHERVVLGIHGHIISSSEGKRLLWLDKQSCERSVLSV